MVQMKDGLASLLNVCSILFFHLHAGTIYLAHFCEGQSQVMSPSQPIVASVGDDIILPCHLEPAMNADGMTVEWSRPDLNPRFVHVWHEGQDLLDDQNPSYRRRTSLSIDKLKLGDISMKLSKVKLSDRGRYKCLIAQLDTKSFVDLAISSTASPVIAGIDTNSGQLVLHCESKGWYPEPEVLWLDSEGNLLSAGPTETVRGPDDLYTVSSRVTVEKSNNITCRIQQKNINQTTETHIYIRGDFLMAQSHSAVPITISVIVALLCIMAVFAFVLRKRNKSKRHNNEPTVREITPCLNDTTKISFFMKREGKRMQPVEEGKKTEYLNKRRKNLDCELKKKKEELEVVAQMIQSLMEQKEELRKLIEEDIQTKNMEESIDEHERKVKSLDEQITKSKMDKAQGYLELKKIMTDGNWSMKHVIREQQKLHLNTQKLQQKTEVVLLRTTEWKQKIEKHIEQSEKELEEIQRGEMGV